MHDTLDDVAARPWSSELEALVRPYRVFTRLAAARATSSALVLLGRRPLLLLLAIATFVSYTASGRLVLGHVAWSVVGWAFLPLLQVVGLALTLVVVGRAARLRELPRLVDLHFVTRAPWLVFLVIFLIVHQLFIDPRASFFSVFLNGAVPIAIVVVATWCRVLEHAFWRAALDLPRWRAVLAVIVGDLVVFGPGIGWYLATEQLQPLLGGEGM